MNCHQILSGACNAGDRCYAVGSVERISFTNYRISHYYAAILPTATKPKTLQMEEVVTAGNNHNVTANTSQDSGTVTFSSGGEAES
ncbi:DmX-like protein 2 [Temnothorax longispinosus]|uniref:DmX-like protein 2 n=1 Tax=Temnothorax longispinosus TaxID=300112 RepID=A0A4S2JRE0_9HYME|nr:DmX-like protein 2 [Temnothorax longispinosus]